MRRRRRATGGKFHEIVSENITCCFIRNLFWVKKKLFSIVLITRNILSFLWNRPDCSLSDRGPESDIVRDSDSGRSLFLFFLSKVGCIPQTMISDNVQSPQKKKRGAVNACRNYLALLPKPKARNGVVMGVSAFKRKKRRKTVSPEIRRYKMGGRVRNSREKLSFLFRQTRCGKWREVRLKQGGFSCLLDQGKWRKRRRRRETLQFCRERVESTIPQKKKEIQRLHIAVVVIFV